MSAVAVFVSSSRAIVLNDSAIYDYNGIPISFDQKSFPVDSWNGLITFRGDSYGIGFAMILCERYHSFDAFIAQSGPLIEHAYREEVEAVSSDSSRLIEIHAIGWSEGEDRPMHFVLRSPYPDDEGAVPFVWRSQEAEDGMFYTRMREMELWRLHRQGAEPRVDFTAETFDPRKHAVPLMEALRRGVCDPRYVAGAGGKHIVGGEVYLTIVDRDGTRQGIIHTWEEDRVDEPIRPAPFDDTGLPEIPPDGCHWSFEKFVRMLDGGAVDPDTFTLNHARLDVLEAAEGPDKGLSRQQRRAAKARARKAPARV